MFILYQYVPKVLFSIERSIDQLLINRSIHPSIHSLHSNLAWLDGHSAKRSGAGSTDPTNFKWNGHATQIIIKDTYINDIDWDSVGTHHTSLQLQVERKVRVETG
jgi:prepilin-type processing-associated H-X9-DG protein